MGVIVDGEREARAVEAAFDYVVIGSGAAGATVARVLADTGASLAVLEEGPSVATPDLHDRLYPALQRLFRRGGTQAAVGRAVIPVIQGSCVGGSTVVNSAIVWRIPEDVWEPWKTKHGLGEALPFEALNACWDRIERELDVAPTPREAWGGNNELMALAQERLGVSAAPTRRNAPRCRASARCLTGCPFGAKQSMLVSYLPYVLDKGGTIFARFRAARVRMEGERALGVEGDVLDARGRPAAPFFIAARRAVIVAASAVQTPGLLRKSGVRSRHLGEHFQAHPGSPLAALFDRPVGLWRGATQGFDADEHRRDGRFKIETISLPPEMVFARLPGAGRDWVRAMAEAEHLAIWAVQMRAEAEGSVRPGLFGETIRYGLTPADMTRLRKGLRFTAEMFFAAGAREVLSGVWGLPKRLRSPEEARLLEEGPADPRAYAFIVSHLFGTARMSLSPRDGVVGPDFCVHGTRNLYVADSSVFPSNLGVNPQHPIMGVAMHAARKLAERRA